MQTVATQQNTVDRIFGWWYVLAAPPPVSENASPGEREAVRRGRFTSIILLAEIVYHLFNLAGLLPTGLLFPIVAITSTVLFFFTAAVLNRLGYVSAAAIVTLGSVETSMCLSLSSIGLAPGGLGVVNIQTFSILIQPDLIAISLFPAAVALPLGLFNSLFSVALIVFLPKTGELQQLLATQGPAIYTTTVSIQLIVLFVSWVWVNSASLEMQRANRAEEVSKLSQALAMQQQSALEEKRQLEESIRQVVSVHMQVANGDFSARVPLSQQNVLWPLAGSLNNLLARLQRWQYEAQQQWRTEAAIRQTLQEVQCARRNGLPIRVQPTGTSLDPLIAALVNDKSFYCSSARGSMENLSVPDEGS